MSDAKKKNILFFFTDQHRKDTLGCYGNNICRTPNIDRLAREGVVFDRGYTVSAICTPARASLLTGVMPHKHNLLANHERNVGFQTELDGNIIPFSQYLKEAGYRTSSIGKWHVGESKGPQDFGFEGEFYPGWCEPVSHPDYFRYLDERGLPHFKAHGEIRGEFPNGRQGIVLAGALEQPVEATFTYYTAERTIEKLKDCAKGYKEEGTPFFLGMHMFGPHLPYYLPDGYENMYDPNDVVLPGGFEETFENKPAVQRNYSAHWCFDSFSEEQWRKIIAMYWGYTTLIDEQIGRVMKTLRDLGMEDDTVIVFSSDHGSFEGSHKLNDKGPAMYEDIYNIPFIVKYPGLKNNGRPDGHFVSILDLTATFVDIACGYTPDHFDGRSLLPLLRGERDGKWRKEIFAEFHGHHFPYPQRMIRSERYKLIVNPPDINEFYDLERDPSELVNRINDPEYTKVINEHYTRLYVHLKDSKDNFHHWMASMFEVGEVKGDASLSQYHTDLPGKCHE